MTSDTYESMLTELKRAGMNPDTLDVSPEEQANLKQMLEHEVQRRKEGKAPIPMRQIAATIRKGLGR